MHIRIPERGRAVAGRALIALILVGAVAVCGWLLVSKPQPPANVAGAAAVVPQEGNAQTGAGPSVLEASAPVQAQAPQQQAPQQQGKSALDTWAAGLSGALDIPERALVGYANAELALRNELPDCHLSWVTLAGIGKASTNHGRYGGASLDPGGVLTKSLGPVPLVGAAGEAANEQRSGPMQLTASEFRRGGGNVQDIDDASIAAGRVLCANGTDLQAGQGWWKAIANYRDSDLFRQQVLGNAQLYATLSLAPQTASNPSVRAVRFALDQLGLPYVWGGNGPDSGAAGFDCSGLTKAAYDSAGVSLPRTADTQYRGEPPVSGSDQLKAGDLVFYGSQSFIHHVGLYLGNGLMINAPTQGMAVQIATYHTAGDDFAGAARPSI